MTCYRVDKYILSRLLQGYQIPKVTHISVDEVYARSSVQQKENETREDLFLTVIVDHRTHKVIWVSPSRRKEALDSFFEMIGTEACSEIKVVTCDQHRGYAESVTEHCPNADLIWDRFHLVQNFNEALNDERKIEFEKHKRNKTLDNSFLTGRNRYLFLQKANNRNDSNREKVQEVFSQNQKLSQLEMIKERFHRIFETCFSYQDAMNEISMCYKWAYQIKANSVMKFFWSLVDRMEFFNYFKHRLTSGVSEGINRAIKGLKWQAYGYKDMAYFALKIMQKCGYLNSKYALSWLYSESA
jgi:transposase